MPKIAAVIIESAVFVLALWALVFLSTLLHEIGHALGYMIGRIFINKEGHYYIEGKRELAQVINNFSSNEISAEAVKEILSSAIRYTLNFDLLVPNYEDMKIITVNDILQLEEQTNLLRTGKRLGFRFEQDKNE